jgi:O-antigen/teichoic acid export membrane protein
VADSVSVNSNKKDVLWNYLATFLQISSGVLLFPVILRMLSAEMVGIWAIFMTIGSLTYLLDFGFSPSFTRNITYIISGVNKLFTKGIDKEINENSINYKLLSGTYKSMRWFYARISVIALIILLIAGTYYLHNTLINKYSGPDSSLIYSAWFVFCLVNAYNIYTLYYDSLLMGFGFIKKSKQLIIISQLIYLTLSTILIFLNFGILSIVLAQGISLLIRRVLANYFFKKQNFYQLIKDSPAEQYKDIIKTILPNSIKLGITSLGAFLVLQSSVIIGSFYTDLKDLASYGITVQIINVIASLGNVYFNSYIPKIAQLRVNDELKKIKNIYLKSVLIMMITYFFSGLLLILLGNPVLSFLNSQTNILGSEMLIVIFLISFLEKNHAMAGGILLLKNEVPFFRAAIISGLATVALLFLLLDTFNLAIWGMILAPGIVQAIYQNWKWPLVLYKELNSK